MSKNKVNKRNDPTGVIAAEVVLRFRKIWRSIAWLIILIIIILSLIPNPDKITPFSASDKLMHALAYAVAMIWFGLCFNRNKLPIIGAGLVLLGITLEFIQGQTGYRTMSLYDIIANCVGVFAGLLLSFSPFSRALQFIEQRLLK